MKYCTDDFTHCFDSEEECLRYEKIRPSSNLREKSALIEKINAEVAQLDDLIQQYYKLTHEELQIHSFNGSLIIRQMGKQKSTVDKLRDLL